MIWVCLNWDNSGYLGWEINQSSIKFGGTFFSGPARSICIVTGNWVGKPPSYSRRSMVSLPILSTTALASGNNRPQKLSGNVLLCEWNHGSAWVTAVYKYGGSRVRHERAYFCFASIWKMRSKKWHETVARVWMAKKCVENSTDDAGCQPLLEDEVRKMRTIQQPELNFVQDFFDPQESAPVMLQLSHVLPIHYLLGTSIPPTHPVGGERGTLQPHTTYLP